MSQSDDNPKSKVFNAERMRTLKHQIDLWHRHLLTLLDYEPAEIQYLLDLSRLMKVVKRDQITDGFDDLLKRKNVAMVFEKGSTRTRCAFEIALNDQGGKSTYLAGDTAHVGKKETLKDTARVLGRMYDAIVYRGSGQENVETLAKWSGVPVLNALTDEFHPTQALADILTMKQSFPHLTYPEMKLVYVGDARNNVSNSLMVVCKKIGAEIGILAPKELQPEPWFLQRLAATSGTGTYQIGDVSEKASILANAHAVYTDVWLSMGEPAEKMAERLELLQQYQVNERLLSWTKREDTIFLHCLPANQAMDETEFGRNVLEKYGEKYRNLFSGEVGDWASGYQDSEDSDSLPEPIEKSSEKRQLVAQSTTSTAPSETGDWCRGMEVHEAVFENPKISKVFDQAENRLHTIKACLVGILGSQGVKDKLFVQLYGESGGVGSGHSGSSSRRPKFENLPKELMNGDWD